MQRKELLALPQPARRLPTAQRAGRGTGGRYAAAPAVAASAAPLCAAGAEPGAAPAGALAALDCFLPKMRSQFAAAACAGAPRQQVTGAARIARAERPGKLHAPPWHCGRALRSAGDSRATRLAVSPARGGGLEGDVAFGGAGVGRARTRRAGSGSAHRRVSSHDARRVQRPCRAPRQARGPARGLQHGERRGGVVWRGRGAPAKRVRSVPAAAGRCFHRRCAAVARPCARWRGRRACCPPCGPRRAARCAPPRSRTRRRLTPRRARWARRALRWGWRSF